MRAVVIHAPKDLRIEERPEESPGPGEVLVRMARGGVCGSDLHYYLHGGFGAVRLREPMILGHEVSGRIEALGAGATGLAVGDLVAVSPSRPDWSDVYAREGLPNHSLGMRFYGSAMPFPHIQGAFRERLVAAASQCVRIPDGMSEAEAAMAEPLAVCLHAARRAGELIGKRVLVTGSGPIGVLCILCARRAGAAEIVATDLADEALAFAKAAGADRVINTARDAAALEALSADKGWFHVLFECTGVAAALAQALTIVRPRGVVVQLGIGGDMTLPINLITAKEIDLRGSFRFHEEFAWAVALMAKGLIDVTPLITQTFPLEQAVEAFDTAADRKRAMKVQIAFG